MLISSGNTLIDMSRIMSSQISRHLESWTNWHTKLAIIDGKIKLKMRASQVALVVKNPPANAGDVQWCGFDPWVGKIPWRRAWQPSLVFLPGESLRQRSLVGCSPWGCRVGHDWSNLTCTHGVEQTYMISQDSLGQSDGALALLVTLRTCLLSHFSHVWLFVTLWTIAHQIPLSKGFSRQ